MQDKYFDYLGNQYRVHNNKLQIHTDIFGFISIKLVKIDKNELERVKQIAKGNG